MCEMKCLICDSRERAVVGRTLGIEVEIFLPEEDDVSGALRFGRGIGFGAAVSPTPHAKDVGCYLRGPRGRRLGDRRGRRQARARRR